MTGAPSTLIAMNYRCSFLFLTLTVACTTAVLADTLTVLNNADSGVGSLRNAIDTATSGDTIDFAAGLNGQTIRLTTGQLLVDIDLTIDASALSNGITISGDADGSGTPTSGDSRIFQVDAGNTVTMYNLTMRDGATPDAAPDTTSDPGGGILNAGDLTLIDCIVTHCRTGDGEDSANASIARGGSAGDGGGIYNDAAGALTLLRTRITFNRTGSGGDADGLGKAQATVGGDAGIGGGIYNGGSLSIFQTTISDNTCGDGGDSINGRGLGDAFGKTGSGGGIADFHSGQALVIEDTTIARNRTGTLKGGFDGGRGGGVAIHFAGSATLTNVTIADNTQPGTFAPTAGGGGVYVFNTTTQITNSTIVGNRAAGNGGGIEHIGTEETVTIENSIVAGNSTRGEVATGNDLAGEFAEAGLNFIGDTDGATGLGSPLMGDPKLGPLRDNGGLTETMNPLIGSPVIDAGIPTGNTPATDQRGEARPFGDEIDIGAVEYFPSLAPKIIAPRKVTFRGKRAKIGMSVTGGTDGLLLRVKATGRAKAKVRGGNPYKIVVKKISKKRIWVKIFATNAANLRAFAKTKAIRKRQRSEEL